MNGCVFCIDSQIEILITLITLIVLIEQGCNLLFYTSVLLIYLLDKWWVNGIIPLRDSVSGSNTNYVQNLLGDLCNSIERFMFQI